MDGVVVDFITPFLKIANDLSGMNYTHDDVKTWDMNLPGFDEVIDYVWEAVKEPGWARHMDFYPGAQRGIQSLREAGADIRIVTSPVWGPTFCYDRMRWIEDNLGLPPNHVIFAHDKGVIEADVFVDDKVDNVKEWLANNGSRRGRWAVLWKQIYNKEGEGTHPRLKYTNNWADLVKLVK